MRRIATTLLAALTIVIVTAPLVSAHDIDFYRSAFYDTWARTDAPVTVKETERTWMWGPGKYSRVTIEPYADSPGGEREVVYFDKTRMEINDPQADETSDWYVTNGLLAQELITGNVQISDTEFEQRQPAKRQIAGDAHPDSPTYAMLEPLLNAPPLEEGRGATLRLNSDGSVTEDSTLTGHGAFGANWVPETDHTVASPFWEFMNSNGIIFDGGANYVSGALFPNPFYATGLPITEAYWVDVPVDGVWTDVLVQCFERRCLTFTPDNPHNWMVETGNIGQHYYQWRYGQSPDETPPELLPPGIGLPDPGHAGCVNINTATAEELTEIVHVDGSMAQEIIQRRPFMYVDSLTFVPGLGQQQINEIKDQGVACA